MAARPRRKWQPQETLRSANQSCTKLAGLSATNTQVTKKRRRELLKGGHSIMRCRGKTPQGKEMQTVEMKGGECKLNPWCHRNASTA